MYKSLLFFVLMVMFAPINVTHAAATAVTTVSGVVYSPELNSLEGVVIAAIPLNENNQPIEQLLARQVDFVVADATGSFTLELPQDFSKYSIIAAKDGYVGVQVVGQKGNHFIDLIMEESIPRDMGGPCYCHHVFWKLYYVCYGGSPCVNNCYYVWGGCY